MTLSEFRNVYKGPLIANCGYTPESAEAAIEAGHADLVAFGRPYITNPDLALRIANSWPLAPEAPVTVWSAPTAAGYTDYPAYTSSATN